MVKRKNKLSILTNSFFGMLFIGMLSFIGLFFMSVTKVNADMLNKEIINNVTPIFTNAGAPILDSDGHPVSSAHKYRVQVLVGDYTGYFSNRYRGAYDWVFIGGDLAYTYTIEAAAPVEGKYYYFKDVTDNGYLKTYKPDLWYLKGGVYEGGKSGADQWYFQRASELSGIYGYRMVSNRDLIVLADPAYTTSLVVNSSGCDFVIVFERV